MLANPGLDVSAVPPPDGAARSFHESLQGYSPTPLRNLPEVAAELGLAAVALKDESARLGLPAFKVLGASWALERLLAERPDTHTLVAASAGNHGRAVAREAARRGLAARIHLPARAAPARRAAIESEGAEVVIVDGDYEQAVALAAAEAGREGVEELADVGESGPARWVIDGYATLFAELEHEFDFALVPIGVGSLGAAAARWGAAGGTGVIGVEPAGAACLGASLAAGEPVTIPTPGTAMAGMDCAEVSAAAWPTLRAGIAGTVTVTDDESRAAMRELAGHGLALGECSAATLAALRSVAAEEELSGARVLLVATEGPTDPEAWERAVGYAPEGFASP